MTESQLQQSSLIKFKRRYRNNYFFMTTYLEFFGHTLDIGVLEL